MNEYKPGRLGVCGEQKEFSYLENNKSTLSLKVSSIEFNRQLRDWLSINLGIGGALR